MRYLALEVGSGVRNYLPEGLISYRGQVHINYSGWLCLVSGVRCFRLRLSEHNAPLSATLV